MIDQIKIGAFLRQLRKEKELTQEELAERFGISSRSVSRWENGNTMPDLGILVDLADYYRIDIKELIDGERKSESVSSDTKEVLRSVADYAELEKKLTVSRKCIVTLVGTLFFVLCVFLGAALLPTLSDALRNNVGVISAVIAVGGLIGLWSIVIHENRKIKKDQ